MPNRIIKESIHTSDSVNAMTDFQFRLWVSLITYVDDYGRGDARPAIIKGSCFPLRERLTNKEITAALTSLAGIGCIGLYTVGDRPYLYFPSWEQHQIIRNKKSRFPAPEDGLQTTEVNYNQLNANASIIQSNTNTNTNPNTNTSASAHKYGSYKNVLLTDEDMRKLKDEFPDWEERIERLSEYMASTGKAYKSHLATIRNWARRNTATVPKKNAPPSGNYTGRDDSELLRELLKEA